MRPHPQERPVRDRLRAAGLRATRPRVLIYSLLREIGGHRSVDELLVILDQREHVVSRMSAYNVVADLVRTSLVMCADVGPGRALYEASDTWHHHFVCRTCGCVEDVPCVRGHKPCLQPPPQLGAEIDEAQVIFRGQCVECSDSAADSGTAAARGSN